MKAFSSFWAIFFIAVRRLWTHRGLMLCVAIGLVAAVALVMSVPLYSRAVNYRLLRAELFSGSSRPPFAFLYNYVGAWNGPIEWSAYRPADEYMVTQAPATVGLPVQKTVRYVKTDNFRLFPASETVYEDPRRPLDWVSIGFVSDLQQHIKLLDGDFPSPMAAGAEAVGVLVYEELANKLGLQVGEQYILFGGQREGGEDRPVQMPIRISGVWQPLNPQDSFWFYQPRVLRAVLLVPEASFADYIAPQVKNEVYLAVWYVIFDGGGLRLEEIGPLLARINAANNRMAGFLTGIRLVSSPVPPLQEYQRKVFLLNILLYIIAIPIIGLVLYFVVLVSNMVVQRQRQEIAMLRSRGSSSNQVLGIYLLECVLLGVLAFLAGALLAQLLVQLMGNARSFLVFAQRAPLPLNFSTESLIIGVVTLVIALVASLAPAMSASGYTIVTYKQELARSFHQPAWRRYFVDFFLLVPPLYGYYMLRQRGTISILGRELVQGSDPFQNPLLFLVPTLFLFALALMSVRFFPLFMRILSRLSALFSGIAWVLALRRLARSAGYYTAPLLLIILTVSLAAFTASMAETMNLHLTHRVYYEVGADMRLVEAGKPSLEGGSTAQGTSTGNEENAMRWFFLPVSEHLDVPGVQAAARVGNYAAIALVGEGTLVEGRFIGIDRVDFPRVAFFRRDFSSDSLGALMNALAARDEAVLVSQNMMTERGLDVGDALKLRISYGGDTKDILFTVAGALDYFPTAYAEQGPFFVGNLEYFFQEMGGRYPYDVWLRTDGRDGQEIVDGVESLGLVVLSSMDARSMIESEQAKPEQGGAFGLLSIGFVTAAALTVLGFLLHSVLSFQERFIELGILRAIGLSVGQMAALLAAEQLTLIVAGVAVGTGVGVGASRLFIPYFQVSSSLHPQTPPFLVQIAWDDILKVYIIFGGMFLVAMAAMVSLLLRMKIFQAVKLGDVA